MPTTPEARPLPQLEYLQHEHGEFQLELPPHALLEHWHDFRSGLLLLTSFRGVLPTPDFSKSQFDALQKLAESDDVDHEYETARLVARALVKRRRADAVRFETTWGCWLLPLKAEYDAANRARYPHLAVKGMTKNTSAHKLSIEHLLGVTISSFTTRTNKIRKLSIDHLCHNHACCNPYHLQAVHPAVNTLRGRSVRLAKSQDTFHGPRQDMIMPFDELVVHIGGQVKKASDISKQALERIVLPETSEERDLPTLF